MIKADFNQIEVEFTRKLAAVLGIMSVSTFITDVILYKLAGLSLAAEP
jgi:hypothetical protein